MKFPITARIFIFICFAASASVLSAQNTVRGEVRDAETGEPLINASVLVQGTSEGTVTDFDGNFEFRTTQSLPLTLIISYVGYLEQKRTIESLDQPIEVELSEDAVTIAAVEVKGRRISEKQQQSALTMETLDNIAIKETPAANFYDGLGSLKEVDLTAASLGFKIINTRGFNSTSPVRSLQIIDGVDNQSPGLNFSLGNFLGASELDVNRVNLIIGASSAFYGPNAFNGVIAMETKDPFLHRGLSVMAKGGERSLLEGGLRWADEIKNKAGLPVIGYKINAYGFSANDWVADNFDPVFDTPTERSNPGGYDAVNIYGDEYLPSNDFSDVTGNPGLGVIHRRGYVEEDLVDYDSWNLKLGSAVHFRLNPAQNVESPTLILASNFSTGTTVYQGDNRYSLRDIKFFQHRIELKKNDTYFFRVYATHEDAGNSYDPYFTALLLQENAKENRFWRNSYTAYWENFIEPQIRNMEGFPSILDFLGDPEGYQAAIQNFTNQPGLQDSLFVWHDRAQTAALQADQITGSVAFFEPGTERFQEEFDRITSAISFEEGGTRFYDKSALIHAHGEHRFNNLVDNGSVTDLDLVLGANYRIYLPDSRGSILLDTFGRNIDTWEYGVYGGGTIEFNNRLKINASLRLDKNENFNYLLSPAASMVYNPTPEQTMRLSFSSAIRNPTLADQYLFYNVGRAILIGNLNGFEDLITIESFTDFRNSGEIDTLNYFDVAPIRPEQVRTLELGYRTTLWNQLYLDATYYYSFYNNFIGFNLGVDADIISDIGGSVTNVQVYRVAANATDRVTTQGFSIGANYYFGQYYVLNGNYSWNRLNTATDDPIIPAFNTPEHKFNFGISGRDIPANLLGIRIPSFGFSVNYKWIDGFLFEGSPQFTGLIPQYDLLDAQINWQAKDINTTFKLGASNVLNRQTFQTYGGPRIGRLLYFSALYEFRKR